MTTVAELFAARLACVVFAATLVRGLLTGAEVVATFQHGLLLLGIGYGLGWGCGELARMLMMEQAQQEFERLKQAAADE